MAESLKITVDSRGNKADARAFVGVLDDILDALDAIAAEQDADADWQIVSLEKVNPSKVVLASQQHVALFMLLVGGMKMLEAGPARPFNGKALKAVKRLGKRIESADVVLEPSGEPAFRPTPRLAKNAARALARGWYKAHASVDGKLDIVNVHAGQKFSVFDEVDGHEVRCKFPERLLEDIKKNIGKRITAIGIVRYNANTDLPVSIEVDSIDPLDESPPKLFSEMQPIDLTGGLPSEEYVRRMRDGE